MFSITRRDRQRNTQVQFKLMRIMIYTKYDKGSGYTYIVERVKRLKWKRADHLNRILDERWIE